MQCAGRSPQTCLKPTTRLHLEIVNCRFTLTEHYACETRIGRTMSSQPLFKTTNGRRADRQPFAAAVQFRSGSRRADVKVLDISAFGARIAGVYMVRCDDQFFLKLPLIEAIPARVIWVDEFDFGCEFVRPLNAAMFEAIVRAIP